MEMLVSGDVSAVHGAMRVLTGTTVYYKLFLNIMATDIWQRVVMILLAMKCTEKHVIADITKITQIKDYIKKYAFTF